MVPSPPKGPTLGAAVRCRRPAVLPRSRLRRSRSTRAIRRSAESVWHGVPIRQVGTTSRLRSRPMSTMRSRACHRHRVPVATPVRTAVRRPAWSRAGTSRAERRRHPFRTSSTTTRLRSCQEALPPELPMRTAGTTTASSSALRHRTTSRVSGAACRWRMEGRTERRRPFLRTAPMSRATSPRAPRRSTTTAPGLRSQALRTDRPTRTGGTPSPSTSRSVAAMRRRASQAARAGVRIRGLTGVGRRPAVAPTRPGTQARGVSRSRSTRLRRR